MWETVAVSAFVGLLAGSVGAWFQSLLKIREKKFELIFNSRKESYGKLHKITFFNDTLWEDRYGWQEEGIDLAQRSFVKGYEKWFKKLKEFYETDRWLLDETVIKKLEALYEASDEINKIFWSEKNDAGPPVNADKVDKLFFKTDEAGKEVREAIQKEMELIKYPKWS